MTSSPKNRSSGIFMTVLAVMTVLWMMALPFSAQAALQGSAGNAIVRNTITVTYSDARGNNTASVSSTVDITVNTVAATPTILSVSPSPGSTDSTGSTQAYTFRIRTNSNGPGSIGLSAADGTFSNIAAGTLPSVAASIFLGSTVIDPTDSNGTIANWAINATYTFKVPTDGGVPSDTAVTGGTTSDGVINGLKSGDIVYLYSGTTYYGPFTAGTVTETAVGSVAASSIALTNNQPGAVALTNIPTAYGWQIVEAKDVTVTVTQGIVANPALAASWVTTLTATMAGAAAANTPTVTTNAHMGRIAVTKYVRNVTTGAAGANPFSGNPLSINSGNYNYYQTGVTGNPKEVLEYLAVIKDDGTGSATAVYATDLTPTYVTLVSSTTYGGGTAGQIFAHVKGVAGTEADLKRDGTGGTTDIGFGNSNGTAAGSTMTFYLGTGSSNSAGGTLATGQTAYVIYQVKID